jgi:glycosyltransferase involved in cell wall biosynthesis
MVGVRHGYVVTQGVRLSTHFRDAGYTVTAVSSSTNRYLRLLDITTTLLRRGRSIDIEIVHVYSGPSFVVSDVATLIGRRLGLRIVLLLHGGALPEFLTAHPRWGRRVLRRAQAIVAPSPYLARAIVPYGFAARVIPNVIDLKAYPFRRRRVLAPRLFWMRSFDPTYNPRMALEVLARLRTFHPEATLVMAGQDKGMQRATQVDAAALGLANAVRFPGFLDMAGKTHEGSQADIFISTSHVDNMPVAVVEACAMGIPVVTTAVGGVPDLITNEKTGLLVADGDVERMVSSVLRLLQDPDLADTLSESGRQLAERSDWKVVRGRWEEIFALLMQGKSVEGDVSNRGWT